MYNPGDRFRCESCGAEIVYIAPCTCPASDTRRHAMICCGRDMERVVVSSRALEHGASPQ